MNNVIGRHAEKEDFYPRKKVIRQILRILKSGNNLYLTAPRRVGKTSIMYHLKDEPNESFIFVYTIVQSVGNEQDFYKELIKQIRDSDAITRFEKVRNWFNKSFKNLIDLFDGVEVFDVKIDLREHTIDFKELAIKLLESINFEGETMVLMIDEFPQAVENIHKRQDAEKARKFLQEFRELLHNQKISKNVQYILTGSIGLPSIVQKLNASDLVNNLQFMDIEPMSLEDASDMLQKLLNHEKVKFESSSIEVILSQIGWLIPFHVQLAAQELIDIYEDSEQTIDDKLAKKAFDNISKSRNKIYFEQFYERLKKHFNDPELKYARRILNDLADLKKLSQNEALDMSIKFKISTARSVLESLEYDGYIRLNSNQIYEFTSPVLLNWWKKYA